MRRSGSNRNAGRDQLPLDLLWGPAPEAQEPDHEPVRSDGRAPLAPLAPQSGGGDGRPVQLLLGAGGGGGGPDRGPDGGPGGGRPAGRDVHGEGGAAEHGPAAGRGGGPARNGGAPAGAGDRGGRRLDPQPVGTDGGRAQPSLWDAGWRE